jgi:hypothetical protein
MTARVFPKNESYRRFIELTRGSGLLLRKLTQCAYSAGRNFLI